MSEEKKQPYLNTFNEAFIGISEMAKQFEQGNRIYQAIGGQRPAPKPLTFRQKLSLRVTRVRETIGQWIAPTLLTEDEAQDIYAE